jgi:membrane protease YdiL (CAAX protease family)
VGVNVYQKINLGMPIIHTYLLKQNNNAQVVNIMKFGVITGIICGVILVGISTIFSAILPQEFTAIGQNLKLTPLARILYGGLTEEILLRFGLMSFLVWLIFKIRRKLSRFTYYSGIILSAFIFAAAHLPVVFQSVGSPSAGLIFYIMLGNSIGGIIFGWIYWKKGLEAAFISHMFAHVVIMLADNITQ